MGSKELKQAIRGLLPRKRSYYIPPDLSLEATVKLRMESLEKQLDGLKGRVFGLLVTLVGAVVSDLLLRLLG